MFLENRRAVDVVRLAMARENAHVDIQSDTEKTLCKLCITKEMNCIYSICKHVSTCIECSVRCMDAREDKRSVCPEATPESFQHRRRACLPNRPASSYPTTRTRVTKVRFSNNSQTNNNHFKIKSENFFLLTKQMR